ncbi:MAG: hypothetical protein JSS87_12815 [Acidobacteria bacterium]|nr:hypothetical protein [Acidobacteriota bacterium]
MPFVAGGRTHKTLDGITAMTPNLPTITQLPLTSRVVKIAIRLTGTLTLASYTVAPTKAVEGIENLIQSIRVVGQRLKPGAQVGTYINVDPAFLVKQTTFFEGTAPTRVDVGTANGAYNFETNFNIYLMPPRTRLLGVLGIDGRLLSSFNLIAQWRDVNAVVSGGTGGTATLSNVGFTTTVDAFEGGSEIAGSPFALTTYRDTDITASKDNLSIENLPIDGILTRQVFKGMIGANDHADPSDALFASVAKAEGGHITTDILNYSMRPFDAIYGAMRADNKQWFGLESMPAGYAVRDYLKTGQPLNLVRLGQKARNVFDVTYTSGNVNTLRIYDERIVRNISA